VNIVDPWPVHVYRLWSWLAAVCRTYSGKCPKIAMQYRLSAYSKTAPGTTLLKLTTDGHKASCGLSAIEELLIKPPLATARASGLVRRSWPSVCLSVGLSVWLSPKCKKTRFSQKLSNLELWCLLTTNRKLCKLNWAFQRTHYWIHTIQDGWDPPSWKSTWLFQSHMPHCRV